MSSDGLSDYDGDLDEPKQRKKRNPPSEPRKLMRWNPDVDQLVLLSVDAVCARLGVALPWEEIAKEVQPFLTADGVKQHLGKIRLAREKAGRRVPSKPEKGSRRKSRANQIKKEEKEEAETGSPTKLAGLLYHGPETQPKKIRTPRKSVSATTPGGSTGKAGRKRVRSTLDREAVLGTPNTVTPTKVTTGKRRHKARAEVIEEEDSDYAETPTKKAKTRAPSYNFRAITKDKTYTQDASLTDNEEEEESLLAPEDDGDGDYKEDGDPADDDKMEDVKSQQAASRSKTVDMAPPPPFKVQSLGSKRSNANQIMAQPPTMQPTNFQPEPIQSNPLQVYPGATGLYHGYDQGPNAEQGHDPFSNDTTPRVNARMDYLQSSQMPHQEVSDLRSTSNQTPRAMQNEEIGTKIDTRLKNTREGSAQQAMQTPKKNQNTSIQIATPVNQMKVSTRTPAGSPMSPFDTVEQTNNNIDAINDIWGDLGMNNYVTTTPSMNMAYHPNAYVQGGGFDHYAMAYYNSGNGTGVGVGNANLHVNTDTASAFGANAFISSPDEYHTSAGADIVDNPLNFVPNMTYANNLSGMPMVNNSGASTQQYSQASALMQTATHTNSFDSIATTVNGSLTDEANLYPNVDGGDDPQTFDDGMDYTNLNGESLDDLFPGAGL